MKTIIEQAVDRGGLVRAEPDSAPTSHSFALRVFRLGTEQPLCSRPLGDRYWAEVLAETWLRQCLCRGRIDIALEDLDFALVPSLVPGRAPRCRAICMVVTLPGGETIRIERTWTSFAELAIQLVGGLRQEGVLGLGEDFGYDVVAFPRPVEREGNGDGLMATRVIHAELELCRKWILDELLAHAASVGDLVADTVPVLITRQAHDRAARFAYRGAGAVPPVETGALLFGRVCSCAGGRNVFLLINHVVEFDQAVHEEFSLRFTSETWAWIRDVARSLQAAPGGAGIRLLGQAHGHPFSPAGGSAVCADCHSRAVCSRHTAFASRADAEWTRGTFMPSQPWACCLIFGMNARSERVEELFSLRDGTLVPRGFHLIPEGLLAETRPRSEDQES
jgi:hypothetical protein